MSIDQGLIRSRQVKSTMGMILTCLLLLCLMDTGTGAQPSHGDIRKGKAIYEEKCLECHGRKGDGKSRTGFFLATRPADFHALESRSKTDEQLQVIIGQGTLFDEMHGWDNELTPQDILNVIGYIRTLAPAITPKP